MVTLIGSEKSIAAAVADWISVCYTHQLAVHIRVWGYQRRRAVRMSLMPTADRGDRLSDRALMRDW